MVGIYFKTNHMPVRFLIYVAMTALTRLLIADVQAHHRPDHRDRLGVGCNPPARPSSACDPLRLIQVSIWKGRRSRMK
mgnify:CR=1 FL=1